MAEGTNQTVPNEPTTGNTTGTAPEIDYGKIETMIAKGAQQKESAILKSYFEQLGMSGEELQTAVKDFKSKRAEEATRKETEFANAQQEVQNLKAQILQSQIEQKASALAGTLGVEQSAIPYALRLADFAGVTDEKGSISDDAVKKALEKVLTDIPALKSSAQASGFVPIGANGGGGKPEQNEVLANIFGTNRKKGSK